MTQQTTITTVLPADRNSVTTGGKLSIKPVVHVPKSKQDIVRSMEMSLRYTLLNVKKNEMHLPFTYTFGYLLDCKILSFGFIPADLDHRSCSPTEEQQDNSKRTFE